MKQLAMQMSHYHHIAMLPQCIHICIATTASVPTYVQLPYFSLVFHQAEVAISDHYMHAYAC